ncbi:carboxypeptidase M32 [Mechercharimyces sp. CAU 1602]|uniref:carboxypeptidase M32 n=1 Tax=Mechercharimyces sp. CAU 1602 TaxID=2973933 RepID=UPI00216369AA|nr:carboxypeptidase M32 [Mechercharimyces sp. CAU 1602]MCS1350248.1 carboxypeptidase M32 [Mechercharimyces sp. CAU 1602]
MEKNFQELKKLLQEVSDLEYAAGVLSWDQSTYMPVKGAAARGRQLATIGKLAHEKFTSPAIGNLLESLATYEDSMPYESTEASLIRLARKQYEKALRVPSSFVSKLYNHSSETYQVWTKARPENDFAAVLPYLEKTLEYSRELASFHPYEHIADPLIAEVDPGMKTAEIRNVFAQLRKELVPLVQAITEQADFDPACIHQPFAIQDQEAVCKDIVGKLGYDFERGRLDTTHHPFMTNFSIDDVRITTRYQENDLSDSLFSTIHEAGHALYELGVDSSLEGTPLASGTSSGVHESQSRLWENLVGRSLPFWEFYYPQLQKAFPEQLNNVSLTTFYRAINRVQRSLIRTDADEVTYNLHVIIRFDLELAMLEGKLAVRDLPEAWHARYKSDLGIQAPDDRDGVLQDIHWYMDTIGGSFQGYTLGNIMSAQFYDAALSSHPDIPQQISQGNFTVLHNWLQENIYQHGRKFSADEILQKATGSSLMIDPYIRYLKSKFGELYNLSL